ncbi:biflaviolin synthase CYP158A2 [Streptomyces albiflavescens]|uniref:Biflaviolin synthase CYP158A2 n=1 Tax=Streptomyces albiflavescens TaxID=1623582 RepID=A0A918D9Y5_9ACTN|nr:cytochrome P450 [Streptomyces albiflavescens]GGN88839.1 biflaviolin synthase CYP158A2 [Streptomyces albiflavescens]
MTPGDKAITCPFDFSEGLDFDPSLAALMDRDSITRIRLPYGDADAWLVTGFEGVQQVTTDHRFSRAGILEHDYPRLTPEPIVSPESINVMDPPYSSRLRRLASQVFTQRQVDQMRGRIIRLADTLLDEMALQGPPVDLVHHLSNPLAQHTIFDLLGVPRNDWVETQQKLQRLLATGPDSRKTAATAKAELRTYFGELVEERRSSPGKDLISALIAAKEGEDVLDDQELAVMALTLTLSGQDTATCQISNISYLLLTRPELLKHINSRPEALTDVLNELLRVIPFRKGVGIPRVALEDVEMNGVRIREGDFVHVSYLTANRDPERYPDPHVIDPDRPPAPHMTFGWGGHRCIAVPLAMAELEVAIGRLLERFPELRLAVPPEEVRWDTETIRRFPLELPVAW